MLISPHIMYWQYFYRSSSFGLNSSASKVLVCAKDAVLSSGAAWKASTTGGIGGGPISQEGSARFLQTSTASANEEAIRTSILMDKKIVPEAKPPSDKDIDLFYQFLNKSTRLMVLTGAGISTECGIPDYRSPKGAYSSGFQPITHQDFLRSIRTRRRYWARSYAGWKRFVSTQPNAAHFALATLEKTGKISCMVTQNVDQLHHRAGSNPLELHGTVYTASCLDCGSTYSRQLIQEQVKALNPKWTAAIERMDYYNPRADESFGMRQKPTPDVKIDEKFWEEDFNVPACPKCDGMLKPDVVFFGDNIPKDRATKAMEAAKTCDAFLVCGSSLMTMSAYRLVRFAHEAGAAIAIVNIGMTRADDIVPLKIEARLGEAFCRFYLRSLRSGLPPSLHPSDIQLEVL
uniref:NAD-dependent protein deacylase n=1 Tax=Rhizophora mucronata TaxID=61149 RepID=A0A2P2KJU1_RHIMU